MKRFFIDKNGRLRIGRVTPAVFLALLLAMGIVFQIKKPVNDAVVSIKHVFEPEKKQTPVPPETNIEAKKDEEAKTNPPEEKAVKTTPEEKREQAEADKKAITPPPEKETKKEEESPLAKKGGEDTEPPGEVKKETAKNNIKKEEPKELEAAANVETSPEKTKNEPLKQASDTIEKESRPQEEVKKEEKEAVIKKAEADVSKTDEAASAQGKIKEENLTLAKKEEEVVPLNLEKQTKQITPDDKSLKEEKKDAGKNDGASEKKKDSLAEFNAKFAEKTKNKTDSITVDGEGYRALMKDWMKNGASSELADVAVQLRVENLRAAYGLFQMKPVAVKGDRLIDLEDGARITENSLEPYSSIVFMVDDPWEKWGENLKKAGVRKNESVEVRYYMYEFIKNAVYGRANEAVMCVKSKNAGLSNLTNDKFDVLGRAYVINNDSGGKFGVFVPIMVEVKNGAGGGKTAGYPVPADCFKDRSDVKALMEQGVL